jgi:hypothetical protein
LSIFFALGRDFAASASHSIALMWIIIASELTFAHRSSTLIAALIKPPTLSRG